MFVGAALLAGGLAASFGQAVAPLIRVDAGQLFRDVETLADDGMEGRLVGSPGGAKARAYILGRLQQAGVAPLAGGFEMPFTFRGSDQAARNGTNLVGVIRGTRAPDRYVVLTAHYDHVGVRNGQVFNGADDNASGVAAVLAVAEYFNRVKPEHSILIALLDGEEAGLQGARALMRAPPVPIASMAVNVNLDMVGRDPNNRLFAVGVYHWPFLKPYLANVAQAPVVLAFGHDTPGEKEDWTKDSDHYAFHEAGVPWIYFGVEDFEQHHKATDDAATIGKEFLAGVAGTVIAAVQEFDRHLGEISARRKVH